MSKVQTLRAFVNQRLSAAAEEICELFETTLAEYEEELRRQGKLLDAVFNPEVRLRRAEADPPEQQDWSPCLDQEDPPELPHIKEEQEEPWTCQEGEQPQGLEEADITKFTFTPVPVKSDEDGEDELFSQLNQSQTEQMKTEADGEDCGGSEPARNFNPDSHIQPATHDKMVQYVKTETDDGCCNLEETRDPLSDLNPLQNDEVPVSDMDCSTECSTGFGHKGHLQKHNGIHTEEKPFSCSFCGKKYNQKNSLRDHIRLHSDGKRFSCSVCKRKFKVSRDCVRHMRTHTGEKPFSCSVCGLKFTRKEHMRRHSTVHTGEKPFSCSTCGLKFTRKERLVRHVAVHKEQSPLVGLSVTTRQRQRDKTKRSLPTH